MNTKPMEVLLFQPISLQPSICHRREKRKVDRGSLPSWKNFAWEALVLVHKPLSQGRVCFNCSWWLVLFPCASQRMLRRDQGYISVCYPVWLGESGGHCVSVKVQDHGELQVINLTLDIKPGYWLIMFFPLAQISSITLRNQNSTAQRYSAQIYYFKWCMNVRFTSWEQMNLFVFIHWVWESLLSSSHPVAGP